jgi:hypothetical protein
MIAKASTASTKATHRGPVDLMTRFRIDDIQPQPAAEINRTLAKAARERLAIRSGGRVGSWNTGSRVRFAGGGKILSVVGYHRVGSVKSPNRQSKVELLRPHR